MTTVYRTLLVCLGLCLAQVSVGQTTGQSLLSGQFNDVPFGQFVRDIETRSAYHFYYNPREVDSVRVRLQVTNKPLTTILSRIFDGTTLRFAIDGRMRVFITVDQTIRPELPIGFFDRIQAGSSADTNSLDFGTARDKARSSLETKLVEIGSRASAGRSGYATLAGRIRSSSTGEPVVGAAVLIEKPRIGVITDQYGSYSISLPRGRHELKIRSIGLTDTKRQLLLFSDGRLDIVMDEEVVPLKEVVVGAQKDLNVSGMQMGAERLDTKTIKQVPTVLGEADLLRVVLTLPGVKTVGEGTVGFNVRGGTAGQNLILFNDAVIYNPSHVFGFFSAFNPDIIKSVELYKSAIPARFGGRLSSVLGREHAGWQTRKNWRVPGALVH